MSITGACPSVRVTVRTPLAVLPAASRAVIVMVLAPGLRATVPVDQLVVPVATPEPPWLFDQRTSLTPTLSAAVPLSANDVAAVEYVAAVVGCAMPTVGTCASAKVT